jgi:hypothetical protein
MSADDIEAIRRLIFTYAYRLDGGDFGGVGEILQHARLRLVDDAVRAEPVVGQAAITDFYTSQVIVFRGDPRTRHIITNVLIELDDSAEHATSRSYFTVQQAPPRLPLQLIIGGQYRDAFAKVDGVWRFEEKLIHVDYLNDVSHHFRISASHSSHDS